MTQSRELATFGAGCFWGVEVAFRNIDGVKEAVVGYMGGHLENPTYEQICTDRTGHAEVVQVTYDPRKLSYEKLVQAFWDCHDPSQMNRQGPDVGTQYRSAIFAHSQNQRDIALGSRSDLQASGRFKADIATVVEPAQTFYPAEDYHQRYLEKRGLASCRI